MNISSDGMILPRISDFESEPPLPPITIKLDSINKFITNISKLAWKEKPYYFKEEEKENKAIYAIWYTEESNAVNLQVKDEFDRETQKSKFVIQGGDKQVSYYVEGVPVADINQERRKLLKKLFREAKEWKISESSEGIHSSYSLHSNSYGRLRSGDRYCYQEKFSLPKEEALIKSCQDLHPHLTSKQIGEYQQKAKSIYREKFKSTVGKYINTPEFHFSLSKIYWDLFEFFPRNLIFSIGSCSWPVALSQISAWPVAPSQITDPAAISQITELKPERFGYVAFDGNMFELPARCKGDDKPIAAKSTLQLLQEKVPTSDQIKFYRMYLSRIGCTPQRILGQESPTVLVNHISEDYAGGIKTFLALFFQWAFEEKIKLPDLKMKLIIQCMYDKCFSVWGEEENLRYYLFENLRDYSSYSILAVPVTEDRSLVNNEIREMIPKANDKITELRGLVKYFPPSLWTETNCKKSTFDEEKICPILISYIEAEEKFRRKLLQKVKKT